MRKIALFGYNTDVPNWGCRSTPNVLRDELTNIALVSYLISNRELVNMIDDDIIKIISKVDIVIINGEGSPIFTTPPRKEFMKHLDVIRLSTLLGNEVRYINSMVSECPVSGINADTEKEAIEAFNKCSVVGLRDPLSYSLIRNKVKNAVYVPDILFKFSQSRGFKYADKYLDTTLDFSIEQKSGKYIGISGGSWPLMADHPVESKVEGYKRLIAKIQTSKQRNVVLISTCNADAWLEKLANELGLPYIPVGLDSSKFSNVFRKLDIFISGRFHPSILASTHGIPCIFFESNSHKTMSLQKMLKYKNPVVFKFPLTDDSISKINNMIEMYESDLPFHSKRILKQVELLNNLIDSSRIFRK